MPEPDNAAPPIIIIKKKVNHGGHHGGAWKVAYADFVTAMMALFIVLWLLNTNDKVKKAVEAYFKDPSGNGKLAGSAMAGTGESVAVNKDNMPQLRDKLAQAMKSIPKFQQMKDNVVLTVTNEGLRVELLENEKGLFFESGSAQPSEWGQELLALLAAELGRLPNSILIEGHTDARPYGDNATYTNWELSTDRANSARRLMQGKGLRPSQVIQVRGFADQHLRMPNDPNHPSNRRISVIVQYQNSGDKLEIPVPDVPAAPAKPETKPSPPAAPAQAAH
ncbi:MAG TPA: flagellar motor protein MotB [Bryobacteraceae bacterium]|nr:flagellar motor protein MotB [Bryobacteraceae bacterium]